MKTIETLSSSSVTRIMHNGKSVFVTYKGTKGNATSTDKFINVPVSVFNKFVEAENNGKSVGKLVQSELKDAGYKCDKKVTI